MRIDEIYHQLTQCDLYILLQKNTIMYVSTCSWVTLKSFVCTVSLCI